MANSDNKLNIGDSWKSLSDIKINVGDSWRTVSAGYVNVGDVWQQFWTSGATSWWTNFAEYSDGYDITNSSDWTLYYQSGNYTTISGSTGTLGDKYLVFVQGPTNSYYNILHWNVPGTVSGDVEILTKIRLNENISHDCGPILHSTTDAYDNRNFYLAYNDYGEFDIYRDVANTLTNLQDGNYKGALDQDNIWQWVRFRYESTGNNLYLRYWLDGTSEPESWDISTSDATFSSGKVGFYMDVSNRTIYLDYISVAINGETAPSPA